MIKKPSRKSIVSQFGLVAVSTPEHPATAPASAAPTEALRHVSAGVIGAAQRSVTDMREERDRLRAQVEAGGWREIDPALIDPSPFPDRLPDDASEDFDALKRAIEEDGQQVPIALRRHPAEAGRYQIIYGHRRWRAAKELDRRVRAFVTEVDDRQLVIAQGVENTARQDLTWIEKALFAARMDEAGAKARDIRAALHVDDAELARFRSAVKALGRPLIEAIGRAPKTGRPRWNKLAQAASDDPKKVKAWLKTLAAAKVFASDERFGLCLAELAPASNQSEPVPIRRPNGSVVAHARRKGRALSIELDPEAPKELLDFLVDQLPRMTAEFLGQ
jgi:ParB family chromosome partitioning protein